MSDRIRPVVKGVVVVAVVAAALFAVAALYVALVFDANRYKPDVTTAARNATGRELVIDGDLALGLFPQPHVRVGAARLANAKGFGGPMVELTSARADVRLLPLLRRQVQIDELQIDGLRLALLKNRKGQDNWADLLTGSGDAKADRPFKVSVHAVRLTGGSISYRDEATKREASLSDIELRSGGVGSVAAPLQLEARLTSNRPAAEGKVSVRAQALIDPAGRKYAARDIRSTYKGSSDIIAAVSGDAALDLDAQTFVAEIAATLLDVALTARLDAEAIEAQRRFSGKLAIREFNPRALLAKLGRAAPQTRDKSALTQAQLAFEVAGDDAGLTVQPIAARLDTSAIGGRVTVANYDAPRIRFNLTVDQLDLDRYRPPAPKPPSLRDNAISKVSDDVLRDMGITVAGEVRIGKFIVAGDRSDDYRLIVEAVP